MGRFVTDPATMRKAAVDIAAAKAVIDAQVNGAGSTASGTLSLWTGAGGDALRVLMTR